MFWANKKTKQTKICDDSAVNHHLLKRHLMCRSTDFLQFFNISLICDKQCHNSKSAIIFFQEKILKILKCYNFLWAQRRHNCPPAASFVNCIMTLYMFRMHVQTFFSLSITQKHQSLSCDILGVNEQYMLSFIACTLSVVPF